MSSTGASIPPSDPATEAHEAKVTANLTHYTVVSGPVAASGAKGKPKPKTKKEVKTKVFTHSFESSEDNYILLLTSLLAKHGEEKYNVSKKMTYNIKVQVGAAKKAEALDVENTIEYKDLADEILENKPTKVTVYFDMGEIQKRWSVRGSGGSDNDEEDPGLYDANGLSDLERELARLRGKLEKKYQNDHNAGHTYIDAETGESHPLTPQMMKEWCRAMYDGQATIERPPNFVAAFNPAHRQIALHPTRIAAGANQPAAPSAPPADLAAVLGQVAAIVTTLVGARNLPVAVEGALVAKKSDVPTSPTIPSPTKLPRFLEHAQKNLGVAGAPMYEAEMRNNGYGPDILHLLDDQALVDCGFSKGDAVRMRAGSQDWWKGPDAKRKRAEMDDSASGGNFGGPGPGRGGGGSASNNNNPSTPPSKKMAFELRYDDGGAQRFWGPRLTPTSSQSQNDKDTFFKAGGVWLPMPPGVRPVHEYEYAPMEEDGGSDEGPGARQPDDRFAAEALNSLRNSQ